MEPKFVNIYPNNDTHFLRNAMFDTVRVKGIEFPSYAKLRAFLRNKSVYINTYDFAKKKSYRNVHFDIRYPLPSNFHIWKIIVSDRKKNILICTEPPNVNPFNYMKIFHHFFVKVYTWNDALVDNIKYFKYRLHKPDMRIKTKAKKFKDKKFLTLINSNKSQFYPFKLLSSFGRELYSERIKAIEFFERKIPNKFSLYGGGWNKKKKYNLKELLFGFKKYTTYKGEAEDKIKVLSGFKYSICFENITDVKGYISEKIVDCFKAKCVPIYWGATDIQTYIPKNCYIDFRDFDNYEKLLVFLNSIDENSYKSYIKNIEKLLADKKFIESWFEDRFSKFFLEDVLDIK